MMLDGAARIARLDLLLLWRNRTAFFSTVGLPAIFVTLLVVGGDGESKTAGLDSVLYTATGDLGFFLILAVFMNLVSLLTGRREERTLKRLRGSALSDGQILGGS